MEYGPLAPVPRYRQMTAILRERIGAGELEADRSIPSEARIQQKFGVARETARKAVALLREEGSVSPCSALAPTSANAERANL
ncbi:MAG TPA: GntR family transcriptional regulator [Streptosporangiaceae bacterium]|nr:GntR family transcriptional regulator [Streptosporangiaceae bacterium]